MKAYQTLSKSVRSLIYLLVFQIAIAQSPIFAQQRGDEPPTDDDSTSLFLPAVMSNARRARGIGKIERTPPNIIVFLADDMGYGDVGIEPFSTHNNTPNIRKLAQKGAVLSNFYVPSPVCSPTRAALMTGQYPIEAGMVKVIYPSEPHGLNSATPTLPEALKDRGYATSIVGKWHLGDATDKLPTAHGFDSFYGMPYSNDMDKPIIMRNKDIDEQYPNQALFTTNITAEATKFIQKHKNEPFFLYVPFTDPHVPLYPTTGVKPTPKETYEQVIKDIDDSVGEIVQKVDDLGLGHNTIIVFTSDNGPAQGKKVEVPDTDITPWFNDWKSHKHYQDILNENRWAGGDSGDLRGGKGQVYEGGVRVPFIIQWPKEITGMQVIESPAILMDLYPTLVSAADGVDESLSNTDYDRDYGNGITVENIMDLLQGEGTRSGDTFVFYTPQGSVGAIRKGEYKLHSTDSDQNLYKVGNERKSINNASKKDELKDIAKAFHKSIVETPSRNGIHLPDLRNDNGWTSTVHLRNDTPTTRKAVINYYDANGVGKEPFEVELLPYELKILRPNISNHIPAGTRGSAIIYDGQHVSVVVGTVNRNTKERYAYSGVSSASTEVYLPSLYKFDHMNSRIVIQNTENRKKNIYIHYYNGDTGAYVKAVTKVLKPYASTILTQDDHLDFGDDGSAFITSYGAQPVKVAATVVTTWTGGRSAAYTGLSGEQLDTELYSPSVFRLASDSNQWYWFSGAAAQDVDSRSGNVNLSANYVGRDGTNMDLSFNIGSSNSNEYKTGQLGRYGLNTRNGGDHDANDFKGLGNQWSGSLNLSTTDSQKIGGINTTIWGSSNQAAHYEMISSKQGQSSYVLPVIWRWADGWTSWSNIDVINLDPSNSTTLYFSFYDDKGGLKFILTKDLPAGASIDVNTKVGLEGRWYSKQLTKLGSRFTGSVQVTAVGGAERIGVTASLLTPYNGNGSSAYTGIGR